MVDQLLEKGLRYRNAKRWHVVTSDSQKRQLTTEVGGRIFGGDGDRFAREEGNVIISIGNTQYFQPIITSRDFSAREEGNVRRTGIGQGDGRSFLSAGNRP